MLCKYVVEQYLTNTYKAHFRISVKNLNNLKPSDDRSPHENLVKKYSKILHVPVVLKIYESTKNEIS